MLHGRTIQTLVGEIMENARTRRDFIVPAAAMQLDDQLHLNWEGGSPVELTGTAHDQLGAYLGIPARFYDRLRQEVPDLIQVNVNRLLQEKAGENRMIRTLPGRGRAILSDRFRPLDNEDLAAHILPIVHDRGFSIKSAEITDSRFFLQIVSERLQGEVRVGDPVQAGFILRNSEVGLGSLSMQRLVYRLRCTNGMITADNLGTVRKAHLGARQEAFIDAEWVAVKDDTRAAADQALWLQMRDAVDAFTSPEGFARTLASLKDAAETKIEGRAPAVVREVTKALGLREQESMGVLEEFLRAGDSTRWGMANAITAQAHVATDYERSVELEALGGKIMAMPANEFGRLTSVIE